MLSHFEFILAVLMHFQVIFIQLDIINFRVDKLKCVL